MKRSLFIGVLSVAVLVAGAAGYFIWHHTTQTPQSFFASGKKYYDQKKYQEAIIQLLNAVQTDPRHRDARLLLARIYMGTGNVQGAVIQLKAMLEYYPDDIEANLELGELYLGGGSTNPDYFRQALELAKKILIKNPNNVDALVLSGAASAGLNDLEASVDTLEKATSIDPENAQALIDLGVTQAIKKEFGDAEKSLIKAHEANPKDSHAALVLANYYRLTQNPAKAEAAFKDALAINPADRSTYILSAHFYFQNKRFDEVEKVLQNAQAKTPDDPTPSLALVNAYELENRPADVRKLLLDLKTKFPKDTNVAVKLATNLIPDQPERARTEIDRIIKTQPKNPVGYVLLGEVQFNSGQLAEAEATLSREPALSSPNPLVHFMLGDLASRKGQVKNAIGHFEKSLAVNKNYVPARMALAEMYLKKGDVADSRQEIQKVLALAPGNAAARLFKTSVDLAAKNYDDAVQELLSLEKDYPNDDSVQRQLGVYYEVRGKYAEAEKSLTHALDLAPGSEQDFNLLSTFYLRNKQPYKAIQVINSVSDANKKAFHYEAMGLAQSALGKPQEAVKAYLQALEKDPKRGTTSQLLFNEYVRENRLDDASKMVEDVIQKNPSNSNALAVRGAVSMQQGKTDDAMKDFEKALQIDPNQDMAANNEAYLLAEQGRDLDKALKYAEGVRKRHAADPNIADTLGWVYYKMKRFTLASDQSQFAVSKQPANPVFQYHLGAIYKANNQTAAAETALKMALASEKDFPEKSQAEALLQDIEHWRHLTASSAKSK